MPDVATLAAIAAAPAPPMHWAAALIGKPYALGARGPDRFDCWGLLQHVWRLRCGVDLPDVGAGAEPMARRVRAFQSVARGAIGAVPVAEPRELDAVYMTSGALPHHIGVWIEPDRRGGVLHAIEGAGVVFQRPMHLAGHGLRILQFMRIEIDGDGSRS